MKKIKYLSAFILVTGLYFAGCEFGTSSDGTNPEVADAVISGQIVESISGDPIFNANVKITDGETQVNTTTTSDGSFSASFPLTEDKELTIVYFKSGYDTDTTSIYVQVSGNIELPVLKLTQQQGTGGGTSSGQAASVYLYSQSALSVGVKESGANESVQFIFEVLDSTGVPISSDNAVVVSFSLSSGPGGGEYLYPASVISNALGRASVTLNTGAKAGVAQITAEFTINDVVVKSQPILIAIYGGFPDPDHFAVASDKLNYPSYGIIGYVINFTAFVGDKYSNPVRPGTSVYFETTSGIIGGSNTTDYLGRATVTMLTQPFPDLDEPGYGPGFFRVTSSTVDENNTTIQTSTIRLLSGFPVISVDPSSIDIQNGGLQSFIFNVSDGNGNPLSSGQTISVKVKKGDIEVSGDVDITIPDTQSKSFTMFNFTAIDSKPDTLNSQQAIIDIETTGPNGEKKISIYGTSR
jgi:hypothetical protein